MSILDVGGVRLELYRLALQYGKSQQEARLWAADAEFIVHGEPKVDVQSALDIGRAALARSIAEGVI